jgi:hypothetical protein
MNIADVGMGGIKQNSLNEGNDKIITALSGFMLPSG